MGEGIQPEHLNDEPLGRVFDKLYDAGLTEIFIRVPLSAADRFGVKWTASTWIQVDFMYMEIMELVLMMKHKHNQD